MRGRNDVEDILITKITSTFNRLTPAQKKTAAAPRLQYQNRRMSLRFPSSPQVDNGVSLDASSSALKTHKDGCSSL